MSAMNSRYSGERERERERERLGVLRERERERERERQVVVCFGIQRKVDLYPVRG